MNLSKQQHEKVGRENKLEEVIPLGGNQARAYELIGGKLKAYSTDFSLVSKEYSYMT